MNKFRTTRDAIIYLTKYVSGNTIDFGAGSAKYKNIIQPHTNAYTTFDMMAGEHIDVVGDALNPPFLDETFDTIISTQMLEHVEKPWVVVHHMRRILKPGGTCIVTAPFLVPYHADPYDFFRYTTSGMKSLFINEGFSIIACEGYGNTFGVLSEMIHFSLFSHYETRSKTGIWFRDTVMNIVKWITRKFDGLFQNDAIYANIYLVATKQGGGSNPQ